MKYGVHTAKNTEKQTRRRGIALIFEACPRSGLYHKRGMRILSPWKRDFELPRREGSKDPTPCP